MVSKNTVKVKDEISEDGGFRNYDSYNGNEDGFRWNVAEWEWRDRREGEERQQAGCAEMWLLCETGKCGEYPLLITD